MSNEPENVGTPKVTIETDSLFGGKKVEQVTVDSNNLNPISESDRLWLDALAIPPRFVDQVFQALTWVAGSGFAASVLSTIPIPTDWLLPLLLTLLIPVAGGLYAWVKFPRLQPFILYRVVLLAVGIIVGVKL